MPCVKSCQRDDSSSRPDLLLPSHQPVLIEVRRSNSISSPPKFEADMASSPFLRGPCNVEEKLLSTPTRSVLILPDLAIGFHNQKALRNLLRFIQDHKPDQIVTVGDLVAPGQLDIEQDCLTVLGQLRSAYDGPIGVHVRSSLRRAGTDHADQAARAELPSADLTRILGKFEIAQLTPFYEVAPGWLSTHGDAGRFAKYGGGKAIGLARVWGRSVVCGGSHSMGLIGETRGYDGKQATVWGFEVGHLMDMKKAGYLKTGSGTQQMGFGILEITGRIVNAGGISVRATGAFVFQGVQYK